MERGKNKIKPDKGSDAQVLGIKLDRHGHDVTEIRRAMRARKYDRALGFAQNASFYFADFLKSLEEKIVTDRKRAADRAAERSGKNEQA